ncbi:MAG: NfeD family protein [Clostridiales bacterium]|jgi:membrane-bound serine protease (ClpP class)|nr:NfeD family protein [Clostridiales bacterium]
MEGLVIVLLVLGIVLLAAEAFFPGFGIAGALGLAALLASAVLMALFVRFGIFYATAELALMGLGVFGFFKLSSKRGLPGRLVLEESLNKEPPTNELLGFERMEGVAVTSLRPIGSVSFAGAVVEAYSDGPFIEAGAVVRAVSAEGGKLVVREETRTEGSETRKLQ